MSTQDLIARIRVILDINYAERLGLAYSANLTDDEFLAFISGNKDLTTEQLCNLEAWLANVEKNIVRPCGHGVPAYHESEFKKIIKYAQQHDGKIHHTKATELLEGDRIKSDRILTKACEDGLMNPPPPPVGFGDTIYTYYYTLTPDGYNFQ